MLFKIIAPNILPIIQKAKNTKNVKNAKNAKNAKNCPVTGLLPQIAKSQRWGGGGDPPGAFNGIKPKLTVVDSQEPPQRLQNPVLWEQCRMRPKCFLHPLSLLVLLFFFQPLCFLDARSASLCLVNSHPSLQPPSGLGGMREA